MVGYNHLAFSILDFRFWILDRFRLQSHSLFGIASSSKIVLLKKVIRKSERKFKIQNPKSKIERGLNL